MTHRSTHVDDHGSISPPGATAPDRPPSRAERRAETAHMLTVLSEALATQIHRLVASTDPAPAGWWFAPHPSTDAPSADLRR